MSISSSLSLVYILILSLSFGEVLKNETHCIGTYFTTYYSSRVLIKKEIVGLGPNSHLIHGQIPQESVAGANGCLFPLFLSLNKFLTALSRVFLYAHKKRWLSDALTKYYLLSNIHYPPLLTLIHVDMILLIHTTKILWLFSIQLPHRLGGFTKVLQYKGRLSLCGKHRKHKWCSFNFNRAFKQGLEGLGFCQKVQI